MTLNEIDGVQGHLPADPTKALAGIELFFDGKSSNKSLARSVYELSGYVLKVTTEDNVQGIDPVIVADSCNRIRQALAASTLTIPAWLKSILSVTLQALLTYIQGLQISVSHGPGQPSGQPSGQTQP
jgi:hypothetical protein